MTFTAKKLFSFFHRFVTAHAIITKLIGLVYLFAKIILISKKIFVSKILWLFGSNSAPKNGLNCSVPLYLNHVINVWLLCVFINTHNNHTFITWFKYRGTEQFRPFFGAEFDPNSHKIFETNIFFEIKMILAKRYTKPISLVMIAWAVTKRWKNENNFLAVNVKIKC